MRTGCLLYISSEKDSIYIRYILFPCASCSLVIRWEKGIVPQSNLFFVVPLFFSFSPLLRACACTLQDFRMIISLLEFDHVNRRRCLSRASVPRNFTSRYLNLLSSQSEEISRLFLHLTLIGTNKQTRRLVYTCKKENRWLLH